MTTLMQIIAALQLAAQLAAGLPALIQAFQAIFPMHTPQQHAAAAARVLARTVMDSNPQLVNGATEDALTNALYNTALHGVTELLSKQQATPTAPAATI